jgi:hypothetical protein
MSTITDTERLDWLQSQTTGYGNGWLARESTTGRGFRLHETEHPSATPNIRLAIDRAMRVEAERDVAT